MLHHNELRDQQCIIHNNLQCSKQPEIATDGCTYQWQRIIYNHWIHLIIRSPPMWSFITRWLKLTYMFYSSLYKENKAPLPDIHLKVTHNACLYYCVLIYLPPKMRRSQGLPCHHQWGMWISTPNPHLAKCHCFNVLAHWYETDLSQRLLNNRANTNIAGIWHLKFSLQISCCKHSIHS